MRARLVWLLLGLLILSAWSSASASQGAVGRSDQPSQGVEDASAPQTSRPEPLLLEDLPQPLVPRQARTEVDSDHLEAISLFAAGRMLERRQDYAGALRSYERAWRLDPQASTIVRSIVPLAFRLKRPAEAVRYALKAVELEDADPLLLRGLGVYLAEEGQWDRAVVLYERALAARRGTKRTSADILLHMEMGRLYHLVDKYDKAADNFAHVLSALDNPQQFGLDDKVKKALLGEPASTYNLFGECFLLADRPKEALAAFEKAYTISSNKGLRAYNLARVDARTGKPADALANLQTYFQQHLSSEGIGPYQLLADILKALGEQDELLERLERLRAADPENVPLGYFLAEQYRQREQFGKAQPLYVALLKKSPTLAGYRGLVEIYRKTNRPEALLATLGTFVAKTSALESLGAEIRAVSQDEALLDALIQAAREQHEADRKRPNYGIRLAVALLALQNKRFAAAGEFFDLAIQARPKQASELLLSWGVGLLAAEQWAEAAKVFQRGIDQQGSSEVKPAFSYYLAAALQLQGQTEEALAAARNAAELKKDSALFASRVAWVLYLAKRYDEAAKAYAALIEKFDANHSSEEVRQVLRDARLLLSNLCALEGQIPQAEEWLEQVLDEFPDDVSACNDLGYLWAERGVHLKRALGMIEKAVKDEPKNGAYRDSLGWVLYQLGRYQESVAELEKAAKADKPDPLILEHLGDACLRADQPEKAKDAWRQAAELFTKDGEKDKAQRVEQKLKER